MSKHVFPTAPSPTVTRLMKLAALAHRRRAGARDGLGRAAGGAGRRSSRSTRRRLYTNAPEGHLMAADPASAAPEPRPGRLRPGLGASPSPRRPRTRPGAIEPHATDGSGGSTLETRTASE